MRTTLVLNDDLVRDAKRLAAELDTTLSEIVNQALRDRLAHKPAPERPFTVITFGEPGTSKGHTPQEFAEALEEQDRERLR